MPDVFQPGATLEGRYRLVSEAVPYDLGSLYRAYDTVDDELVTVLVLPFEITVGSDILGRLSRAQRAVAALGQPGLVSYEYGGMAQDRLYLVRRQIDGRPLADLLAQGPLDPARAVAIAIVLSDLVALLHRAGIVHGSLSPYCVYVDPSATTTSVSVTDCGLLPALRQIQAPPGRPWGRAPYLSPEQAAGEEIYPSTDVYVIGSLLYAMLAGRPPFRAADETVLVVQHLRQTPPALDVLLPDLSAALCRIVEKALAKEPAARYRNSGQLAQILRSQAALPHGDVQPLPASARPCVPAPPPGPRIGYCEPEVDELDRGVDWIMIALILAALLAMFGLVELWRTVYDRYTVPGAYVPSAEWRVATRLHCVSLEGLQDGEPQSVRSPSILPTAQPANAMCAKELDDPPFIWYNTLAARRVHQPVARDPLPVCGVKITGFAARLC